MEFDKKINFSILKKTIEKNLISNNYLSPDDRLNICNSFNNSIEKLAKETKIVFTPNDLNDGKELLGDLFEANNKFYTIIADTYFPNSDIEEYHHFTGLEAFNNIIKTKSIYLFCVGKRFKDSEFLPFYQAHGMDGYEKRRVSSKLSLAQEITNNSFYISFTEKILSDTSSKRMWSYFGKNRKGVRLVFKINFVKSDNNLTPQFRKIFYSEKEEENSSLPLLREMMEICERFKRKLVFNGLSTIGFFYLPGKYSLQNEHRLLIEKKQAINYFQLGKYKKHKYIKLPINDINSPINISLIKVIVKKQSIYDEVEKILIKSKIFKDIPIIIES